MGGISNVIMVPRSTEKAEPKKTADCIKMVRGDKISFLNPNSTTEHADRFTCETEKLAPSSETASTFANATPSLTKLIKK
jgi:hypothetical protein